MASLAEIHDILQNICRQDEVVDILIWANPVWSAYHCHEMDSPLLLKTILCFEDIPWGPNCFAFDTKKLFRWQYKEGEGIVGKALKYNRPLYAPFIELKENVCPYIKNYWQKGCSFGALAVKLSSAYANCGDYVVEFWFQSRNMKLEAQKPLVHHIIDYLKDVTPRFVTYGNQDPLVELPEHDTAVSDTMLMASNPPSQSTSDFNLNLINQTVGNAMDGQLPMQQFSFVDQLHYTGVLDAMPTQGNLQAQSTDAFGFKGKTIVVNPRDGNVLQWPHEQGPPIQLHVSATSNTKASRENVVAPPFGDFNLNKRISSSGINHTAEYHVTDVQVPHKQVLVTIN
ncbi:hypothetical protein SLEP1_g46990 [Rubroshorea leprosula]|uniref:NLP1-9 GAF domain-containing protein n=1 Tax=Rubroshorea leprosula TaxID=152421 RepID=A0AAV5LPS6_9ROSI|nr:hypothetical protein SLEP1_g46990 [Rubroshorea leprosula]